MAAFRPLYEGREKIDLIGGNPVQFWDIAGPSVHQGNSRAREVEKVLITLR
jgi:hypothetical protein